MIPDEIVEKATRAAHETHCTPNCACVITLAMDRDIATAALSAVYADIQAEALRPVLDLHKVERRWLAGDYSYDTEEEARDILQDGDPQALDLCQHCQIVEDGACGGECAAESGYLTSLWPCSTYKAATKDAS